MSKPAALALALLLTVVSASPVGAAEYRFDTWTIDSGLPQNSVNAILQTRDGYIWLATFDGLARFDGVRFIVFSKANTPGITSNRCYRLYEDRDGALWAGRDDRGITHYKDGRFTSFGPSDGLPESPVRAFDQDPEGHVLALTDVGIFRFVDGRFHKYTPEGSPATRDFREYEPGGFAIWDGQGLRVFRDGRYLPPVGAEALPSLDLDTLARDQYGATWVATQDRLVTRVRDGNVEMFDARGLPPGGVTAVCGSRAGPVWIGTRGGLGRLHEGKLTVYPLGQGIPNGKIITIYEDREGLIWLGTAFGLCRLSRRAITVVGEAEGVTNPNLYPILEDREGSVWMGSWGGGLYRYRDGAVDVISVEDGLPGALVAALCEDRDGRLWVGTQGSGVGVREGDRFTTYYNQANGLPTDSIGTIYQDRAGAVWIGTHAGLTRVEGGRLLTYGMADGLSDHAVRVLHEDRRGALWIGTLRGLCTLRDGRIETPAGAGALADEHIRAIHEDADGTIWVGTYDGGLARIRNGRAFRFTVKDGLFDNGVFHILEDDRGNFWMSSNRGIFRVARHNLDAYAEGGAAGLTCVAYGRGDGMRTIECNGGRGPAGWKTRDGRLWFPTQAGAAVIDPASLPYNPVPPPVVIEAALLDNVAAPVGDTITVGAANSILEIRYTGLSFVKPEGVRYKYRMEGVDDEWVDVGTRRAAYYSHLSPGVYTFTVIAANADGVWNATGRSLRVVVEAPLWRRWWFWPLALAVLAVLGVVLHRWRLAALERRNAEQEAFSRSLIESQEAERKRIAGELHDSIGQSLIVIKNRAMLALSAGEANGQMEAISDAASHAITEVRSIAYGLHPYQLDRLGLTKALESLVKTAAASSDVTFAYEIDPVDGVLSKDAEINLYRIVQEGINNVLKHSEAAEAYVSVRVGAASVQVTIRDDGRGFAVTAHDGARRGLGLHGMAERAKMLGGALDVSSAPGTGTVVRLRCDTFGRAR